MTPYLSATPRCATGSNIQITETVHTDTELARATVLANEDAYDMINAKVYGRAVHGGRGHTLYGRGFTPCRPLKNLIGMKS